MDAKSLLEDYVRLQQQIIVRGAEIETLSKVVNAVSVPSEDNARTLENEKRILDEKISEYLSVSAAVTYGIEHLEDPISIAVLRMKFLQGYDMARIANEIGYSDRQIYRLYDKAVKEFGEIMDDTQCHGLTVDERRL